MQDDAFLEDAEEKVTFVLQYRYTSHPDSGWFDVAISKERTRQLDHYRAARADKGHMFHQKVKGREYRLIERHSWERVIETEGDAMEADHG